MTINRSTLMVIALAFAIGWYVSSSSPPAPTPPSRPVLSWMAKTAKRLLWLAVFLEPAPKVGEHDDRRMVQAHAVGADGYQKLDNARAF